MNYKEELQMLKKKTGSAKKWIKLLPGFTESGYLASEIKRQITPDENNTEAVGEVTLEMARASMGWPSKDITVNSLKISNEIFDNNIGVRIYQKANLTGLVPVIVFLHGGGFFGGSLDNVEHPCRVLADKGDIIVVSVDYGLAPERKYPEGLLDCYRAVKWIYEYAEELGIDKDKITIAGDSAGGNLSIATTLLDRNLGTNFIKAEVLLYATVKRGINGQGELWDASKLEMKEDTELITKYVAGFAGLDAKVDNWYMTPNVQADIPFITPVNAKDLELLPPTLVAVGEFDPLRLQNNILVDKLREAKVPTEYIQYNGMIHAFMDQIGDLAQAEDLMEETINFVLKVVN
ncbi:alpha/beta hydrolase [Listeria monocytogenes]|uniref:alpha/beta hydrolase n=1 Tax=Listeria monocytogenes TaxID=1639 RepID=UPI0010B44B3F|nr:alpha/beta hydrolase [Listeria monocytogenes]EAC3456761.1 alpha/beta hydrolase [Listeria monocytogenes]EAC4831022.1 alpha/beta hydrolase [Listeria monocytogenes]EAC6175377.1 alpha/beta hydrolase [Listeria monocytogenes]EAC8844130.1 alpha/beta hydrolase [Listeria monocytogenes]EAD0273290.1 alpha/beta hydrolase [Listeria monocytogenes]